MWLCFSLAACRNSSLTFAILVTVCLHLWFCLSSFSLEPSVLLDLVSFQPEFPQMHFWSPPLLSFPFGFPVMCMAHKSHMFLFINLSVFFWPHHSFQDPSSQPSIEPRPPALQVQSPNYGTVREFLCLMFWLGDLHYLSS